MHSIAGPKADQAAFQHFNIISRQQSDRLHTCFVKRPEGIVIGEAKCITLLCRHDRLVVDHRHNALLLYVFPAAS